MSEPSVKLDPAARAPGELPQHLRPDAKGFGRVFWEGAMAGELHLPKCVACSLVSWPPRARCPTCGGNSMEWINASGRGVVHTYTIVRQSPEPYFKARAPYVVAIIELDEGVRIMGNVVECDPNDVRIDMPVRVAFQSVGDGLTIPVFHAAAERTK